MVQNGFSIGLPRELAQAGALWPFAPSYLSSADLNAQLLYQLPSLERANVLAEAYFTNFSWLRSPIDRDQVYSELIPLFYPPGDGQAQSTLGSRLPSTIVNEHQHDLALLFALFACGAVADLSQPPDNLEAARFGVLSRAALSLQSVFEEVSLSSCQALFLLGTHECQIGLGSIDNAWKIVSLALFPSNNVCFSLHSRDCKILNASL